MNTNMEALYWRKNEEWYTVNEKTDKYELTEKAPKRAIESFELFKKLNKY